MSHPPVKLSAATIPRLIVVQDQMQDCPYRSGQIARMPLELPIGQVNAAFTDWILERGYRRSGDFVYRTRCPSCNACEPTRLGARDFRWTKSLKRILKRGDRELVAKWCEPIVDQQRVQLFNQHRVERGLDTSELDVTAESYHAFLINNFGAALELSLRHQGKLISVSIVDVGEDSLSAVYTMFEPSYGRYSPGTYSILKEIEKAVRENLRFVYLGMYVAENRHLNYKSRFQPQQRFRDGRWVDAPLERVTK